MVSITSYARDPASDDLLLSCSVFDWIVGEISLLTPAVSARIAVSDDISV